MSGALTGVKGLNRDILSEPNCRLMYNLTFVNLFVKKQTFTNYIKLHQVFVYFFQQQSRMSFVPSLIIWPAVLETLLCWNALLLKDVLHPLLSGFTITTLCQTTPEHLFHQKGTWQFPTLLWLIEEHMYAVQNIHWKYRIVDLLCWLLKVKRKL